MGGAGDPVTDGKGYLHLSTRGPSAEKDDLKVPGHKGSVFPETG